MIKINNKKTAEALLPQPFFKKESKHLLLDDSSCHFRQTGGFHFHQVHAVLESAQIEAFQRVLHFVQVSKLQQLALQAVRFNAHAATDVLRQVEVQLAARRVGEHAEVNFKF